MLEKGEILTLEDGKDYVVASSIILDGINYVYLIGKINFSKIMFCSFDQEDGLYEVEDPELLRKIMRMCNEDLNGKEGITAEKLEEYTKIIEEEMKDNK